MLVELEITKDLEDILIIEVEQVSSKAPVCPLLLGNAGIGKSSLVKSLCEKAGWAMFELLCQHLGDRSDLTGGRPIKTQEEVEGKLEEIWKQVFFPHQEVQDAISCAKNNPDQIVVLFLDEINRVSSDITSAILAFTTARKVGSYKFPDNLRFIVAGNDTGHVTAFDDASLSRFALYKLRPSTKTYLKIEPELNKYIKEVLKKNPTYIFCKDLELVTSMVDDGNGSSYENEYESFDDGAEGFRQFTTPRTISGLSAFLNACSLNMLSHYLSLEVTNPDTKEESNYLQAIVYGHVGKTLLGDAVLAAIAEDVSKGMLQSANAVQAPDKPDVYDDIMCCSDRQTRDNMIQSLSDDEKSAILVYATWEKNADNTELINAVASNFSGQFLTAKYQPTFTNLKSHDELDADNYAALITSGTQLGDMIRNILGD